MSKPTPLSCGGKGPCCHVGYAHRHCEHCDEVVATSQPVQYVPWYVNPTYPPYQTWYSSGTMSAAAKVNLLTNTSAADAGVRLALPEQTWMTP